MKYVLDASAVIAFLRDEPGALTVRDIFLNAEGDIHIHAVNAIEVHYKMASFGGESAATDALHDLAAMGVAIYDSLPPPLCVRASHFKSRYPFLSLGDSVCVAFGEHLRAVILTTDRAFANIQDGVTVNRIR